MRSRTGDDHRYLETLFSAGTACGLSDAELLERFVVRKDEAAETAFEALVLRHGPMVLDIGSKILGNAQDAQDVFQATFLILATKARSILRQRSVGSWLHGVAVRVARRARTDAVRRKVKEREMAKMSRSELVSSSQERGVDVELLHAEVQRLPQKYREPLVLCYLEGMNLEAVAAQLGCPIGTVGVRLMRAKQRLKTRLGHRGVSLPAALFGAGTAASTAEASLPSALVGSTVRAAIHQTTRGMVSPAAATLASIVLRSMVMAKLVKTLTALAVVSGGAMWLSGMHFRSGTLIAQEAATKSPNQVSDSWIGKQAVTKYGVLVAGVSREPGTDRIFRIFTVRERKGEALRLEYQGESGWIDASEVLLFENALDFYNAEIRAKPSSAAAYQQRGLIWTNKGQLDKAIADYNEVIRLDPSHAWAYANRGNAWSAKGDQDKAIADLGEAIRLDPQYAWAYGCRGYAWSEKNNLDKAIADYTETIRIDPKATWAYISRGNAWFAKNEYDRAIADYTEAIRLRPEDASAYDSRASAWTQKKELDKAITDYTEAIRLNPKDASAYDGRGYCWTNKEEHDKAIADYTEAIRLAPGNTSAFAGRGFAWSAKNEYDNAIADYTAVIKLDPKDARAHFNRGIGWGRKREHQKAIVDFTEAIRIDPKYARAYSNRGTAWSPSHDDKAILDYTEAIRLDPQDSRSYFGRGGRWLAQFDYDKAIADYTEAIRLNPKLANAFNSRGLAWSSKDNYGQAIADLTEGIRLDPRNASAFHFRGSLWSEMKKYDEAIADYTEAIRLDDPDLASFYSDRGVAWWRKHEYTKATADFTDAIQLRPKGPEPYNSRAWIWATCPDAKHRNGKKAVESAMKACELADWKNPEYLETLAAAFAETGDFASATKWQTTANALHRTGKDKATGESRLKLYQEKKPYRDIAG
jgi:RNA polymerase sigma factor (sigma-70 family)